MANIKFEELSAAEIGNLVNTKQVRPIDVVKYFEKRIIDRNKSVNAFVFTNFAYAEDMAYQIEEKINKGINVGPFAGVPFALKDFLPSKKGWTHSHGGVKSLIKDDPFNSEFCNAMEAAGGIAIGKTNAPAFGFRGTTDNKLYGPTSTPFNTLYNSGGSSGGSAAAIADGLVPIAEGGDAGGSIRIPAAWCNLYGFKPSIGTVPSVCRPDAWAATHPYCFNGGLTKTVLDSAILLNYMAKFNPLDPYSLDFGNIDYTKEMQKSIKGYKIAYTNDFDLFEVDDEVKKIVKNAALKFVSAGASVDEVHFNFKRNAIEYAKIWCRSISVDTAIEMELDKKKGFDLVKDHRDELPEEFIYYNELAINGNVMDYYNFNLARTEIFDEFERVFADYDLIISPTTICLPVRNANDNNTLGPTMMNKVKVEPIIGFTETFLANFTGNPACSIPAGLSKDNLPVGMQIIGKRFKNSDVLAASYTFEKISPWKDYYKIPFKRKY